MCIRDSYSTLALLAFIGVAASGVVSAWLRIGSTADLFGTCLLYTSDAADERSSVDLGGRRIIKKKKLYIDGRLRCRTR